MELWLSSLSLQSVSVSVETAVIPSGDDSFLDEAWALKEEIRREEGVLRQRRDFFDEAYRQATTLLIRSVDDGELIGFASTRANGYLLFLAVSPAYREMGFGRELVAAVADEHDAVTCHARVSNEDALEFYDRMGFEIVRRVNRYYEDGGDAYFLRLGEETSFAARVVDLFRG